MEKKDKLTIALLSAGHFTVDAYSSFLLPLLPMLATKLELSPAQAGLLVPTMMISSSLMQPVYGMISDRFLKRAMSVTGPLVAGLFFSCIGLANNLTALMVILICGGIGIGMFHPQSAAIVARAGHKRQATAMSLFSSAGTVGVSVGPLIIALVVASFGLSRSYYTAILGIVMFILLVRYCPKLETRKENVDAPALHVALRSVWMPLTLLYLTSVFRSAVHVSLQTYLPFHFETQALSLTEIGWVLSAFIFFGGVGGFFGGTLADRFGARRVSLLSLFAAAPLLVVSMLTTGGISYTILALGGTFLSIGLPVNVVMAQRLVPHGASTVSALMMGFAWGAGALLAPLTGTLSESIGLKGALIAASMLTLVAAIFMLRFPRDTF
ncbi:MAG TPA: MFS transporter, partial [Blastocatellia bacterium]|nr:MFS transporter [Blastocatellia bacterium]